MRIISTFLLLAPFLVFGQKAKVLSGPMQGHTTHSTIKVWALGKHIETLKYVATNTQDSTDTRMGEVKGLTEFEFKHQVPFRFEIDSLSEAATYTIDLYSGEDLLHTGKIKTIKNYDVDDFSFVVGSCAFVGTGKDRLYKLWNSTRMLNTVADEKEGDFMLWLGDNLYLLGGEIRSKKKSIKRYNKVRRNKKMNHLLKRRFHYATWDDHDYGPNNCDGNFTEKDKSKVLFENYWLNPNEPHSDGIYFSFKYADIEIFMLDDRYNRNDKEGDEKRLLGPTQLEWLKTGLSNSTASFKLVVCGNQVLNQYEDHESFMQYEKEKNELFGHIKAQQINGVLFFSGDRHHAEILKRQEEGCYPFYDFTCSALTSWRYPWRKLSKEGKNDLRVGELMLRHNYSVVNISGIEHARVFKITYKDKFGKVMQEFELKQNQVSY